MTKSIKMGQIVERFRESWLTLTDVRKGNNSQKYTMADGALAAFSVFFTQSPSFLSFQRDMEQKKRNSNAQTLFKMEKIPSDQQIRNLLDPVSPAQIHSDTWWVLEQLAASGHLENYRCFRGTFVIALDGVTYHSSTQIRCDSCQQRQDSQGTVHYYHSAIAPVLVKPDCRHVLSLPPECIVPQDGHQKQDCERAASKRWLQQHSVQFAAHSVTYLGDDLYANQPLCELIDQVYEQYFVFVCKPDSHTTLYQEIALLEKVGGVTTHQVRHWNGRQHETWTYRLANQVPLRSGSDALNADWCELRITHAKTDEPIYHNAWVTNHSISVDNVAKVSSVGRTRWKIENENINVLKNQGYHLEHNFGHGEVHLANTLFTLNLLAFLVHTALHIANDEYRLLRETLAVRRTFFHDLRALTRYMIFNSWQHLFDFMIDGLEIQHLPP
jgi:hypothetical protein